MAKIVNIKNLKHKPKKTVSVDMANAIERLEHRLMVGVMEKQMLTDVHEYVTQMLNECELFDVSLRLEEDAFTTFYLTFDHSDLGKEGHEEPVIHVLELNGEDGYHMLVKIYADEEGAQMEFLLLKETEEGCEAYDWESKTWDKHSGKVLPAYRKDSKLEYEFSQLFNMAFSDETREDYETFREKNLPLLELGKGIERFATLEICIEDNEEIQHSSDNNFQMGLRCEATRVAGSAVTYKDGMFEVRAYLDSEGVSAEECNAEILRNEVMFTSQDKEEVEQYLCFMWDHYYGFTKTYVFPISKMTYVRFSEIDDEGYECEIVKAGQDSLTEEEEMRVKDLEEFVLSL